MPLRGGFSARPAGDRRLRGGDAGDRHAVRGAADVVDPGKVEEGDRGRGARVLSADPETEVGPGLASDPGGKPDEPADAGLVDRLERAAVEDPGFDVAVDDAALDVVAGETERRLGQVVGAEGEE